MNEAQVRNNGSTDACSSSWTVSLPTKKNGRLKRSLLGIPANQKKLLDQDCCWVEVIRENGLGASCVPPDVLKEVQSSALKLPSEPPHIPEPGPDATTSLVHAMPAPTGRTPAKAPKTPRGKSPTKPSPQRCSTSASNVQPPTAQVSRTELQPDKVPSLRQKIVSAAIMESPEAVRSEKQVPAEPHMEALQPPEQTDSDREGTICCQAPAQLYSPSWPSQADNDEETTDTPSSARHTQRSSRATPIHAPAIAKKPAPSGLRSSSPIQDLDVELPDALGERSPSTHGSGQPSQEHSQILPRQRIEQASPLQSRQQQQQSPLGVHSSGSTTRHDVRAQENKKEASSFAQPERRRRLMKEPSFPKLRNYREETLPLGPESIGLGLTSKRRRSTEARLLEPLKAFEPEVLPAQTPIQRSVSQPKSHVANSIQQQEQTPEGLLDRADNNSTAYAAKRKDESSEDVRAATAPKERVPQPQYTWKLPYETFKTAYPDFKGDLEDFLRACYCIQGFAKSGSLASFLYDDVIRAYVDFIGYVQSVTSGRPMSLLKWYNCNVDTLEYSKKVVTTENVASILAAYPKKVDMIRQIIHSSQESDSIRRETVSTQESTRNDVSHAAHTVSNELMERVARNELSLPSTTLTYLAGSGSTGDSSWPHRQPSNSQLQTALFEPSLLSDYANKDGSQDQGQSQNQSQLKHRSHLSSSGLDATQSPLVLPSSLVPTAAMPPGMDRVSYLLQSPAQQQAADDAPRRLPAERRAGGHPEEVVTESAIRRPIRKVVAEPVRHARPPAAEGATSRKPSRKRSLEEDESAYFVRASKRHASDMVSNTVSKQTLERKRRGQQAQHDSEDDWFEPSRGNSRAGKPGRQALQPLPVDTGRRRATIATSGMQAADPSTRKPPSLLDTTLSKKQRQSMQDLPGPTTEISRRFGEFLRARASRKHG